MCLCKYNIDLIHPQALGTFKSECTEANVQYTVRMVFEDPEIFNGLSINLPNPNQVEIIQAFPVVLVSSR